MDIKRRDVLTGTITSPLLDMIKSGTPATQRDTTEIPTALDLPHVPASEVITTRPTPLKRPDPPQDARPGHHLRPLPPVTGATSPSGSRSSHTGAVLLPPGRPLPRATWLATPTLREGTPRP